MAIRRRNWSEMKSIGKTQYGDQVVCLTGSQIFSAVSNTAGSAAILAGSNPLTLSPDAIGGTVAGIANRFNKYFFRKVILEYVPFLPNSTDGHGFAFGLNPEAPNELASANFSAIATLQHSMVLPMTGFLGGPEMNCLEWVPDRRSNPWYWNEDDSATSAGQRQTIQASVYGAADGNITNATTWGTLWLHFELELTDLTPDQGFTLTRRQMKHLSLKSVQDLWYEAHPEVEDDDECVSISGKTANGRLRRV